MTAQVTRRGSGRTTAVEQSDTAPWCANARPRAGAAHRPLPLHAENDFNVLAAYYDVPPLSLRAAVWPLIAANAPGFRVQLGKYCLQEHKGNRDYFCVKMRRQLAEQGISLASVDGDAQLYAGEKRACHNTCAGAQRRGGLTRPALACRPHPSC